MNTMKSLCFESNSLRFPESEDLKDFIMSDEKHSISTKTIDGITFTINTITVEINPNYKYSLSSAIIPIIDGNGVFIRQVIPTLFIDGEVVHDDRINKYSWQHTGSGMRNLLSGHEEDIESCYYAFQWAARSMVAG